MNAKFRNLAPNGFGPQVRRKKLRAVAKFAAALGAATVALLFATAGASLAAPLLPVPVSTSPSNGDLNPYGVLFVSGKLGGKLRPGDILVSNFNDKTNTMFLGTTIVDIRNGKQTATPFYTSTTAAEGLSLALGSSRISSLSATFRLYRDQPRVRVH